MLCTPVIGSRRASHVARFLLSEQAAAAAKAAAVPSTADMPSSSASKIVPSSIPSETSTTASSDPSEPTTKAISPSSETTNAISPSSEVMASASKASMSEHLRAYLFFSWSVAVALPLLLMQALATPLVIATDKYRRLLSHTLQIMWSRVCTWPFYQVEVQGRENLPPPERPVVYVANHQSFLDIYSLFHLERPFKFISKASIFLLPIVGWSMFMTGHIGLHRNDRRSQLECLKQCGDLLKHGAPVIFFPEGHRSPDGVMAGFKKGAFGVAVKAGVDVVPITLLGTGRLMPSGAENVLRAGCVRLVVHPPIPTLGRRAEEVCHEAREAIASAMPEGMRGSESSVAVMDC